MNKWRITVGILLVFALGTAAGAYGSRLMFKKRISTVLHANGPPGAWAMRGMFRRLDLSEAQRKSIDAILNDSRKKWETIQQEFEPKIQALFEKVIEDTKKELTPQQREQIERMSANIRDRLPPRTSPRRNTAERQRLPQPPGPNRQVVPGAGIVDRLQLDGEKAEKAREIIEESLKRRGELMAKFRSAVEPLESTLQKDLTVAQTDTEKKLEGILTADQLRTYRQLVDRSFFRNRESRFDTPSDNGGRR